MEMLVMVIMSEIKLLKLCQNSEVHMQRPGGLNCAQEKYPLSISYLGSGNF